ncbi:putative HNHc nuclease [Pediococcus inopinatus]|uniref:putative HNHc nuclease n=1 Tax=Pediococcus inopinatus TaxID=114090 RepID=UPI002B25BC72|nr:putative HNHc nuclease [Pediococcus inopinatus]WPC19474.1 putative HNHc nuclease [Pediococcus inopinatus]
MQPIEGRFKALSGNDIQIHLADLKTAETYLHKGYVNFDIVPHSPMSITADQRSKAYAMIHDIGDYIGYDDEDMKITLKEKFRSVVGCQPFSLSDCHKDTATAFISYLVEYCFYYGIPFFEKDMIDTIDANRWQYLCLIHKRCAICGRTDTVEINHVDTVGNGNNRNHIDHRKHRIEALCHTHHMEFHQIGAKTFAEKYHMHGVKLKDEDVVKLGLMSWKQIREFDEQYKDEKLERGN